MGKEDPFTVLRDDTIEAFEQSTGELPSDVEMGTINMVVREYLEERDGS
jgi:hypothetical protein